MLDAAERKWLTQELGATIELSGREIGPAALALLVADLAHIPKQHLRAALTRIRAEHKGPILSGTVLQYVEHAMGRMLPNEAYALALAAQDERATVVWTDEIAEAWRVAHPLVLAGDRFGARTAFLEAYGRITGEARVARRMPELQVSLGHDAEARVRALQDAAARLGGPDALPEVARDALGLPPPRARAALPAPTTGDSASKAQALLALKNLGSQMAMAVAATHTHGYTQRLMAVTARRRLRQAKRATDAAVQAYQAEQMESDR